MIHCQRFHELAMDYRSASFLEAEVAYRRLTQYIDSLQRDLEIDAARWRYSMEFQDLSITNPGCEQPKPIVDMWRLVYAEHRLAPTRAEYEAAMDASIAAITKETEK